MGKGPEQTFLQGGQTAHRHKKMLNVTNHQRNKTPPHTRQDGYLQ